MQEIFEKIIKELRESKVKITAESRKVSETDNDCIFDKSDILDERAAGVTDALKVVRRILREYNEGWIPCSERMPEEDGYYTVTEKIHSLQGLKKVLQIRVVGEVAFMGGKWSRAKHLEVIAWQPLPKPYIPK